MTARHDGVGRLDSHRVMRVRADRVRARHIVEWLDWRCRVVKSQHECCPGRGWKVVLRVEMLDGPETGERFDLRYWIHEDVTVLGLSL